MPTKPLQGVDVLVVEDDYFLASDLERLLGKAGAHILGPFRRAEQAREALRGHGSAPIAAVLDVNLAGSMVYPLADDLRRAGVPFIFATGYDAEHIPLRYEAVPKLVKPLEPQKLLESIRSIVAVP